MNLRFSEENMFLLNYLVYRDTDKLRGLVFYWDLLFCEEN
jgi:hypothetical protein